MTGATTLPPQLCLLQRPDLNSTPCLWDLTKQTQMTRVEMKFAELSEANTAAVPAPVLMTHLDREVKEGR